jgi:L-ascorbate metabolism protein UlaG (beta-lactamase superfamily)
MRTRRKVAVSAAAVVTAIVAVLLHSTEWLASLGGRVTGPRLERSRRSPQFHDGKFRNPEPTRMATGSMLDMARRQFFGKEQREPSGPVPVERRSADDYETPPPSGLRATWIGWASVLVELDGRRILTDPVWSERCSPSTLVGPKRFHPPPIALKDLPPIDAVVISHDHYDHLDMPTVRALAARGTHLVVPLGIGAHLERWDIPAALVHELDWNESFVLNGLTFTSTRARHYSGRNPLHANETLWTSWVVKGPRHRLFFSGDTGYSEAFAAIGREHGPFDLTLIKIGASDPTWSEIHMTPEEAIRTHVNVGGKVMLPVHWATFNLGFHSWSDPVERTVAAATASGVRMYVPRPGELVEPSALPAQAQWWEAAR